MISVHCLSERRYQNAILLRQNTCHGITIKQKRVEYVKNLKIIILL